VNAYVTLNSFFIFRITEGEVTLLYSWEDFDFGLRYPYFT